MRARAGMRAHRARHLRRGLASLLGAWVLVFAAEASPHLVHHAFDTEEASPCAFLAVAEHAPGDVSALPGASAPLASTEALGWSVPCEVPPPPADAPASRAPPAFSRY
jgi:hypothetical protein